MGDGRGSQRPSSISSAISPSPPIFASRSQPCSRGISGLVLLRSIACSPVVPRRRETQAACCAHDTPLCEWRVLPVLFLDFLIELADFRELVVGRLLLLVA